MAKLSSRDAMKELGASQGRSPMGFRHDEFIPDLRGARAIKKYREMRENDAVIGGIMLAMEMMLRRVEWRIDGDDVPDERVEFAESLFMDMSHSFSDWLSEVVSFLTYGFHFSEVVYKRRQGPMQDDPSRRSQFNDGMIGIRKLATRAQWTLERFAIDDEGGVKGFVQTPLQGFSGVEIPIEKGLLIRTTSLNNNPMGRSVLRSAYVPYYYASHIENIEAIAIERELNGLPVAHVPGDYLSGEAEDSTEFMSDLRQMLRDVKFNDQGYMILPSDEYQNEDGSLSGSKYVQFELVASKGTRNIETGPVIQRHQQNMARTVLADFIMLGAEKGSFALSKSKTDLFLQSMQGYIDMIEESINRHLLPKVWMLNGLPMDQIPKFRFGNVAPADLQELGEFVRNLSGAGIVFSDNETENALRESAGLPEVDEDTDMLGRAPSE